MKFHRLKLLLFYLFYKRQKWYLECCILSSHIIAVSTLLFPFRSLNRKTRQSSTWSGKSRQQKWSCHVNHQRKKDPSVLFINMNQCFVKSRTCNKTKTLGENRAAAKAGFPFHLPHMCTSMAFSLESGHIINTLGNDSLLFQSLLVLSYFFLKFDGI
jgi:hypothetical protein